MEISPEKIKRTETELIRSEQVMARWKGTNPRNPNRLVELADALRDLREARKPLSDYCKTGRHVGRKVSDDPIRKLNERATKTINRLRSMIDPRPGTKYKPKPKRTVDETTEAFFAARSILIGLRDEFNAMEAHLSSGEYITAKGGGKFKSVAEYNREAKAMRKELNKAQSKLEREYQLFLESDQADNEERGYYRRSMDNARKSFEKLRHRLLAAEKLKAPPRPPHVPRTAYERWTSDDIIAAWVAFQNVNGKLPTVADLSPENGLPYYTQVYRVFGPSPMKKVKNELHNR